MENKDLPYIPTPGKEKIGPLSIYYEDYRGYEIHLCFDKGYSVVKDGCEITYPNDRPETKLEARLFCDKYDGTYEKRIMHGITEEDSSLEINT